MVSVQEVERISAISADDADPVGAVESQSIFERESNVGKLNLLDWYLYWTQSAVQSLPNHLISSLCMKAGVAEVSRLYISVTKEKGVGWDGIAGYTLRVLWE